MKPLFKDKICAVVAAPTAREMQAQLRRALKHTRTLELRIDWLKTNAERLRFLRWLQAFKPKALVIGTLRTIRGGGKYRLAESNLMASLELLGQMRESGCHWLDLGTDGVEVPWDFKASYPWKPTPGVPPLIYSRHDFGETRPDLVAVLRFLDSLRAGAVKVATQCHSLRDAVRVLNLTKGRRDVIAVPMGEIGLPARVLALKHGSALAYAAVGEKTAPGQLTLDEMKSLYRADLLNRRTRVYGVIGNPVAHSLSPQMHNAAFRARRVNAVYLPFLVEDLRDFLAAIEPLGISGFSITLPWKERILRYLDDCDLLAERIGAVNTVMVSGHGKLYGRNTDYVGVLRALERKVQLRGSRVLILGAGGAARAVAFALAQGGAVVNVCARRPERARKLARAAGGEAIARRHLRGEFFDAIINATPVGMFPRAGASPLMARELNTRLVFDAVYRPMRTRLMQLAERRGIETVSGLEMFVAQGTAQWEIWTGLRAPEALMRKVVLQSLRQQGTEVGGRS